MDTKKQPLKKIKKACIICPFTGISKIFNHDVKSSVASDRLQIAPLRKALNKLSYDISVVSLNKKFQLSELKNLEKFDLCFISKMRAHEIHDDENLFAQFHTCCALWLKRNGSKIITIYSDNVAEFDSAGGELYRNLLYLSDHIITPSKKLNSLSYNYCKSQINRTIIEDPCLLRRTEFKPINHKDPIRLIWFGNASNLKYLARILKNLIVNSDTLFSYELKILTSIDGINELKKLPFLKKSINNWKIVYILWDIHNQPGQLEAEISSANISLLPSDPLDIRKCGVSHNRLVDSIQSGCVTIASPIDSYIELSKLCLIGENFTKLFHYAIVHNERLCNKYSKLRPEALQRFDRNLNIQKWEKVILTA